MVNTRGRPRREQPNPDPEERPDPIQQILGILTTQQATINALQQDLQEMKEGQRQEPRNNEGQGEQPLPPLQPEDPPQNPVFPDPPAREVDEMQNWITKFNKHKPTTFLGKFNPQRAENWLARLEKIFRIMRCPSEVKAQLAIYLLEDDAEQWWQNTEMMLRDRNAPVTWELFREKFNEKYFPDSVQIEKEAEFLSLKQEPYESFEAYLARFVRLSRYSSYLRYRSDEGWSANWLVRGLKPELREKLASQKFTPFNEAIKVCRITENNLKDLYPAKSVNEKGASNQGNNSHKRKGQGFPGKGNSKKLFGNRNSQGSSASQNCPRCRKPLHPGKRCPVPDHQIVCFNCNKPGHIAAECRHRLDETRPRNQGRVFAIMDAEARKSPELIQDTILLMIILYKLYLIWVPVILLLLMTV